MLLPVTTAEELETPKPKAPPKSCVLYHGVKLVAYLMMACVCFSVLVVTVLYLLDLFIDTEGE